MIFSASEICELRNWTRKESKTASISRPASSGPLQRGRRGPHQAHDPVTRLEILLQDVLLPDARIWVDNEGDWRGLDRSQLSSHYFLLPILPFLLFMLLLLLCLTSLHRRVGSRRTTRESRLGVDVLILFSDLRESLVGCEEPRVRDRGSVRVVRP